MPFWCACWIAWQTGTNKLQPLARREVVVVAVRGDRNALNQLHDEIGPAGFRGPGVEHSGDVDVVHHGQRLPLGLEAGDHLPTVHARLDDLERDLALDRPGLLGHEDDTHSPFADLLQQLVGADHGAWAFVNRILDRVDDIGGRGIEKAPGLLVSLQEHPHPPAQCHIVTASLIEVRRALGDILFFKRYHENVSFVHF